MRLATRGITGEDYVSSRLWECARLSVCPLHPQGGCGFASHGTYARVRPAGTRIRRWYCPRGRRTFSALPDCLSARLSGELVSVEALVRRVEQATSLAAAVRQERPEIGLAGVLRYVGRRVRTIHRALQALRGLYPHIFQGTAATVTSFAAALDRADTTAMVTAALPPPVPGPVLGRLRELAHRYLDRLPAPLGFAPTRIRAPQHRSGSQHGTGADRPLAVLDPACRPGQSPPHPHRGRCR